MSCETVAVTLQVVGDKWKGMILWQIYKTPRKFQELNRDVPGITSNMLTQQLQELEGEGIIRRRVLQTVPAHVEYSLSDYGTTLCSVLEEMARWGRMHAARRRE